MILYVLQLKNGKYYIGKSKNVRKRIDEHFNGGGSEWTKRHRPIRVVLKKRLEDIFEEDILTLKYMGMYGIDNVRGGSFTQKSLLKSEKNVINRIISTADNRCFRCGSENHFVKDCEHDNNNNNINEDYSSIDLLLSYFKLFVKIIYVLLKNMKI